MSHNPISGSPATGPDPTANMRAQLCQLLPHAMQNAIASYQQFSQQLAPDDAKQFIIHHNGCRAALAHLDALSKLGKWLIAHQLPSAENDRLQPLLMEARRVLTQLNGACDESEADDESGTAEF